VLKGIPDKVQVDLFEAFLQQNQCWKAVAIELF